MLWRVRIKDIIVSGRIVADI